MSESPKDPAEKKIATKLTTQPYKGTRDFYPEDMAVRKWMFQTIRQILESYGYLEYDGPMLEPLELYASKTSEEIVRQQLYSLVDRGGRELAVRPEMTPTLARMVAGKIHELPRPIRWYSIPNLWRYERPQRGRLREHWQLNVDVFGGDVLAEDLEVLTLAISILKGFGAPADGSAFQVKVNHRALTDFLFRKHLQLTDELIAPVGRLLDAAPKAGPEVFARELGELGLPVSSVEFLVGLLSEEGLSKARGLLADQPAYQHLMEIQKGLAAMGWGNCFVYDPSIMRGFMYYTGTVFEVFDLHPDNNRALFGGGRYDDLVGLFGVPKLSGVGFGMGDVTLLNFLQTRGLVAETRPQKNVYISVMDSSGMVDAQILGQAMRTVLSPLGLSVMVGLHAEKPKKAFATAEKLRARFVLFFGEQERELWKLHGSSGTMTYKDGFTGQTFQSTVGALAETLVACLGATQRKEPIHG